MKYFLDTANLNEIRDGLRKGVVTGVTTNPSILAKEPKTNFLKHIKDIANLCKNYGSVPLSVEVFAQTPDKMRAQALELVENIDYSNLNFKIPIGFEELEVINQLASSGVDVNCTCCFTTTQLQLGAQAGARYVSLFYNRLIDNGGDPIKVLRRTRKFLDKTGLNCEIIAGSIRNPYDVEDAWHAGADIVTASHKILTNAAKHPKTDESVAGFLKDFNEWMS